MDTTWHATLPLNFYSLIYIFSFLIFILFFFSSFHFSSSLSFSHPTTPQSQPNLKIVGVGSSFSSLARVSSNPYISSILHSIINYPRVLAILIWDLGFCLGVVCENVEPIFVMIFVEGEFVKDQNKVLIIPFLDNLKRIRCNWDSSFVIRRRGYWDYIAGFVGFQKYSKM